MFSGGTGTGLLASLRPGKPGVSGVSVRVCTPVWVRPDGNKKVFAMKLRVQYAELEGIVSALTGQAFGLSYVDSKTFCVQKGIEVKLAMFNFAPKAKLDISVERIEGKDVEISYGGGLGIDFLLKMALSVFKTALVEELVERLGNNRMVLHLGSVPQMQAFFDYVEVMSLSFEPDNIVLEGRLKVEALKKPGE